MKKIALLLATAAVAASVTTVPAAIISVNTEDNTDFSPGKTNLVTAINSLNAGDTINFNIPGSGPHYLVSPGGGYPMITNKNNITIDGYSQPGSAPNTNSILASNNAQINHSPGDLLPRFLGCREFNHGSICRCLRWGPAFG